MQAVVDALTAQHRELDEVLGALAPPDWDRPSRCPGWSIADVVLHLAQTDALALNSARGDLGTASEEGWTADEPRLVDVDAAADRAVSRERGPAGPELHRRWRTTSTTLRDVFAGSDPRQPMPWVAGVLPARTLATTRLAEAWIHTGDILAGLDRPQVATERIWHIARLAWRTYPHAFAREGRTPAGSIGVELRGPGGATWGFGLDAAPATVVRGDALDFCLTAARRLDPAHADLTATGPDAADALRLARTFA